LRAVLRYENLVCVVHHKKVNNRKGEEGDRDDVKQPKEQGSIVVTGHNHPWRNTLKRGY
jgi:hypothetical protein